MLAHAIFGNAGAQNESMDVSGLYRRLIAPDNHKSIQPMVARDGGVIFIISPAVVLGYGPARSGTGGGAGQVGWR